MRASSQIGNPMLTPEKLARERAYGAEGTMTVFGTVWKYALLISLVLLSGGWIFVQANQRFAAAGIEFENVRTITEGEESRTVYVTKDAEGKEVFGELPHVDLGPIPGLMIFGLIGGFIVAMICIFKQEVTPFLSPIYALLEGLALGGISAMFEVRFGGIVMQALALTVAIQLTMLILYALRVIKVTGAFLMGLMGVMFGYLLLLFADILMQSFTGSEIGILHSNSGLGIGFSIFICIIAALNFAVDFDAIEEGVKSGAAKRMEWYGAFAMLLTLVWLYLEILHLLAKLKSREKD